MCLKTCHVFASSMVPLFHIILCICDTNNNAILIDDYSHKLNYCLTRNFMYDWLFYIFVLKKSTKKIYFIYYKDNIHLINQLDQGDMYVY